MKKLDEYLLVGDSDHDKNAVEAAGIDFMKVEMDKYYLRCARFPACRQAGSSRRFVGFRMT